jgi:patatin-like phospholipase/acyl hydrolase
VTIDSSTTDDRRYRILSLDGGGIKGAYTASVLHTLETITGKSIREHFDLVTGTSTGGIIAIAIGLGVPLAEIVDLYVKQGPVIFPIPQCGLRGKLRELWRHCIGPKHSQAVLASELKRVFGERRFGASANRLVIPSFNALNGNIQLFKTAHCAAYRMDCKLPATTVALATSAAPTYFKAFTDEQGRAFLDGGVWANCPAVVGLVEATAALGWPIDQIDVLSIGTTTVPFDVNHARRKGGIASWNRGLLDLFQEAQMQGMLGLAGAMTKQRVFRVDAITRSGRFSLDDAKEVMDLKGLGENSARQIAEQVAAKFLHTPADCFVPIYDSTPSQVSSDLSAFQSGGEAPQGIHLIGSLASSNGQQVPSHASESFP